MYLRSSIDLSRNHTISSLTFKLLRRGHPDLIARITRRPRRSKGTCKCLGLVLAEGLAESFLASRRAICLLTSRFDLLNAAIVSGLLQEFLDGILDLNEVIQVRGIVHATAATRRGEELSVAAGLSTPVGFLGLMHFGLVIQDPLLHLLLHKITKLSIDLRIQSIDYKTQALLKAHGNLLAEPLLEDGEVLLEDDFQAEVVNS